VRGFIGGLHPQRRFEVRDRFGDSIGFDQGIAEIVVGVGIVGIDAQGRFKMSDPLWKTSGIRQNDPEISVGAAILGLLGDGVGPE